MATSALTAWNIQETVEASIVETASKEANIVSQRVAVQLIEVIAAGNAIAGITGAPFSTDKLNRATALDLLKAIPTRYEHVFGAWMADISGPVAAGDRGAGEGINEQGYFAPAWSKDSAGGVSLGTFKVVPTEQWYAEPAGSGRGAITEPFISNASDLLTSVSYPLKGPSGLIGLAGAGINLSALSRDLGMIKPFGDGRAMLVSAQGAWLAHPDASLITKPVADESAAELKAALKDGRERVLKLSINGMRRVT